MSSFEAEEILGLLVKLALEIGVPDGLGLEDRISLPAIAEVSAVHPLLGYGCEDRGLGPLPVSLTHQVVDVRHGLLKAGARTAVDVRRHAPCKEL